MTANSTLNDLGEHTGTHFDAPHHWVTGRDYPDDMDPPFPALNLLHANNLFGLASRANLDRLPPKGEILIAAPLKIVRGTGSPIRAMALAPKG